MDDVIDLSRLLCAFFAGAFLCLSGSFTQVSLRNPLAAPSTLGIDGLGVLGVLICFFLGIPSFYLLLFLCGSIGLVFFTKNKTRAYKVYYGVNTNRIILIGLSFNLLVGAIFSLLQFLMMAFNLDFPSSIWFGNFKFIHSEALLVLVLLFFLAFSFIYKNAEKLEVFSFGDQFAQNLNIDSEQIKKMILCIACVLNIAVILYCGVFSFLGLLLPHLLRLIPCISKSFKLEVLLGPIIGGVFLMLIDSVCYFLPVYGAEIPSGMIFSVLGAIALLVLLLKQNITIND